MRLVALLTCGLLLLHPGLCRGQDEQRLQLGQQALVAQLWEVAAEHFSHLLQQGQLSQAARHEATFGLAEALIRDGKAQQALTLLEQKDLAQLPEALFWKGQALAANGRFAQAVETLDPLLRQPAFRYNVEAGLTNASLLLALDQADEAIKTLSAVVQHCPPTTATTLRLRQVEILLDLGRIKEAAEILPDPSRIEVHQQGAADFLRAVLLERQGQHAKAAALYKQLAESKEGLDLKHHQDALIGQARCLQRQGQGDAAAEQLLNMVQKDPENARLDEIFELILTTIPDQPGANDPILTRLAGWISAPEKPSTGLVLTEDCHAVSAWPDQPPTSDLIAFCLYTRAIGLARLATDEARMEAHHLLTRLRLEYPTHFLTNRALLVEAQWLLDRQKVEQAHHLLTVLSETATSPLIMGRAAFLQAQSTAMQGSDPVSASQLFEKAAANLRGLEAQTAHYNAALIELVQNHAAAGDTLPALPKLSDPRLAASLQLERALAIEDPARRRAAIELFLMEQPEHPREAEARMVIAETALLGQPLDLSFALAQVQSIESKPELLAQLPQARLALLKLRITDLSGDAESAISQARALLADHPTSLQATEASFILGRNLYQTSNYNEARLVLQKLAAGLTDSSRAQAAWLLAARSAALVPTTQSQNEALGLFDKAAAANPALTALARLEKARLMIDMNLLAEAAALLGPWYKSLPVNDPLHLPVGLLLGESIYAQGNLNPDSLEQALAIYDDLLEGTERFSADYDRLQYLRGLTLEQLPDPEIPTLKREKQAFIAYHSVLERETPPANWEYFELCGFRALSLLEKAQRWPAAIACARRLASFNGPRSAEAATRAEQIQLKHMIWED